MGEFMSKCTYSSCCISTVIVLGLLCGPVQAVDKKDIVIGGGIACAIAIASGGIYGHIILPWYTNKKELEKKKQQTEQLRLEQEQWRTLYRNISSAYNSANIPLTDSNSLIDYKGRLAQDLLTLEQALNFMWEDLTERDSLVKLIEHLKDHQSQVTKLIGSTIGQEVHSLFKDELTCLARDGKLDPTKISTLVYEKYGDTAYKFTNYKNRLNEAIATCKLLGASVELVASLENLNKSTNYLFATSLDQERLAMQNADREDKKFRAELDEKYAAKKFFQEAQRHVQQSTQTVHKMSEEITRQVHKLQGVVENCSNTTATLINLVTSWGYRNSQQYDQLVYEIREEGRTTRNALGAISKEGTKIIERKLDSVKKQAQQAQAQSQAAHVKAQDAQAKAQDAQQQAKTAHDMADVALGPLPPACNPDYVDPNDPPKPSAPPLDE